MKRVKSPVAALRYVVRRLHGRQSAFLAVDNEGKEGLCEYLRRCIKAAKTPGPVQRRFIRRGEA